MRYDCHQCELCSRTYVADKIVLMKLDYSAPQITIRQSPEYYEGIRAVCVFCVQGIKSLPVSSVPA